MPSLHSLPGPEDITRFQLPNGVVILVRPNFESTSVVLNGYLCAGSLFEPDEKLGLADFTALALMRGTQKHDFQQLFDLLETAGASLGVDGGTHSAGFSGRALAEDLDILLEILAEVLRQPVFPPEQVERLRAQLLTSLAVRAQDTASVASLVFDKMLYPSHPYSRPEDGYPETIQAITRQELQAFHQAHYGPQGMVIAIVGAVEPERAIDRVARVLGDWCNPIQTEPPPLPSVTRLSETHTQRVSLPRKSQADILLGAVGPQRRSPDFLAASLGNSVLGQFGMFGRIGQVVREQAGLAYYASSSLSGGVGPGPWFISAGVDPLNIEQVVGLVRAEIERFISEPVSDKELADSQANFIGRMPLSLESNAGVAGALLNLERYDLGLDYYRLYPDLIAAITPSEVLEAARRYLHPDRLAIAIAGTFDDPESEPTSGR